MKEKNVLIKIGKAMLVAYLLTGLLLFLLAFLMDKMRLPEEGLFIGICVVYVMAGGTGGYLMGKQCAQRKFLGGLFTGFIYFAILFLISLGVGHSVADVWAKIAFCMILCSISGMLGGMIS